MRPFYWIGALLCYVAYVCFELLALIFNGLAEKFEDGMDSLSERMK